MTQVAKVADVAWITGGMARQKKEKRGGDKGGGGRAGMIRRRQQDQISMACTRDQELIPDAYRLISLFYYTLLHRGSRRKEVEVGYTHDRRTENDLISHLP